MSQTIDCPFKVEGDRSSSSVGIHLRAKGMECGLVSHGAGCRPTLGLFLSCLFFPHPSLAGESSCLCG